MYLLTLGTPPWIAFIAILLIGSGIGFINGMLSFRLQGQALILTLGTGFAVSGGTQILTSIGTAFGGNVFGTVPGWLSNLAAMNGVFLGLDFPARDRHLGYCLDHSYRSDCATLPGAEIYTQLVVAAQQPVIYQFRSAVTG